MTVSGLAMIGYGVYLLVEWNKIASGGGDEDTVWRSMNYDPGLLKLGRPMLVAASMSSSFLDKLPRAW